MSNNPFASYVSRPGEGRIVLNVLPPSTAVLETLSYQYPLKLIAPSVTKIQSNGDFKKADVLVHTVFLLTYGGGLVAGDEVLLNVHLAPTTRLVLLTQGSTKIFKSPSINIITRQHTIATIDHDAALCYLPDPVQPFESSVFEQRQTYNITSDKANLCVCDWVCEGRTARGERWSFSQYASRNEVWLDLPQQRKRLLLRDNLILDANATLANALAGRMEHLGVFGTLIICGHLFHSLTRFFQEEFHLLPRIGSRQWDAQGDPKDDRERLRVDRIVQETKDGILWTVAETRGFSVVKFGAREVEGAKRWLKAMFTADGTIQREFGEGALLCLR